MILSGDIGATKSCLAIFPQERGMLEPVIKEVFTSADYPGPTGLTRMLQAFLALNPTAARVNVACLAIAGPVIGGRCKMPSTGWETSSRELRETLDFGATSLINDMPAIGYAVTGGLTNKDLLDLNPLSPKEVKEGNRAVILATGAGLGELLLHWNKGDDFLPSPSEGGHANFAPRDEKEIEFLRYLRQKQSHVVSLEQVISWNGLGKIYTFLRDVKKQRESKEVATRFKQPNPDYALIPELALQGDALCKEALNFFIGLYGAEAGDLALRTLAVNGVYVAGTIALKIKDMLIGSDGTFMQAFIDKEGQFAEQNAAIPVKLITNPEAVFIGATHKAREMANIA